MASPRDLDPKFKDEKRDTVTTGNQPEEKQEKRDDETPMIVHRQPVLNSDGSMTEKVHGPMPVSEWPAYEKENNL